MSYPITASIIPGLPQHPYRNGVGCYEGVVAHSTATPNATAGAERNYELTHYNEAFVHFFVDWTSIVQTAPVEYLSWNCGPQGNSRFVGVELCETADPTLFAQSYARYTWLLAKILFDRKLDVKHQVTFWTHHDISTVLGGSDHTDPVGYLQSHGATVDKLIADVTAEYQKLANPNPPGRTVKIVGATNGAILMDVADRVNGKNIGVIPFNTVVQLISPVDGINNPGVGYFKVAYNGKVGYINAKYGQKL